MTREAEFAQKTVADKGHTRHVAAVFQQTEEEEQQNDYWDETQYAAHAAEDAIDDERLHGRTDIPTCQGVARNLGKP